MVTKGDCTGQIGLWHLYSVLGSSNPQILRLQGGIHVAALKQSYNRLLRPGRLSGCLAGRPSALRHLQRSIVPSAQRASNGSIVITKIGQGLEKPHCGFQNQEIGESRECNAAVDRATGVGAGSIK